MAEPARPRRTSLQSVDDAERPAGLVRSRSGPNGGYEPTRDLTEITLRDVYEAVDERPFEPYDDYPNSECPVGVRMPVVLYAALEPAVEALTVALDRVSIADLAHEIRIEAEAAYGRPLVELALEYQAGQSD